MTIRFALLLLLLCGFGASANEALDRALAVLENAPVVDGHNDLPWVIREEFGSDVENYDISAYAQFDTDIPRMREGRVGTQFWSVYVPSSMTPVDAMRVQLEQINIAHRIIERYPDDLVLALTVDDIDSAKEEGRIASLLGMEGGHTIVNSLLRCTRGRASS